MTAETDFRAALLAHAPLSAAVQAVSLNAAPEKAAYPNVIYSIAHSPVYSIDGALLTDQCAVTVQCWAETAVEASDIADKVVAALSIVTYPALLPHGPQVQSRSTEVDTENGLDAVVLTVEWWA